MDVVKAVLKLLVAGAIGVLAIVAGFVLLNLYKWPVGMSNGKVVALIVLPFVIGLVVAVGAYRLIQIMSSGSA